MKEGKLTTIALAFAFSLSSTFALATRFVISRTSGPMTCIGVCRWSDHVLCIRTTAIQTVQPACPRADTCGTEGAPPSGAAASSVLALGLKSTYTREMHLAFCPSLLTLLPSSPPSERTNKPTSSVEVARLFPRIATHRRAARPMDSDPATRRSTSFENLAPPGAGSNLSDPIKHLQTSRLPTHSLTGRA